MSTHASTVINQKEYLKKYLSGNKTKKKKKHKKETRTSTSTVKIIDDDVNVAENGHEFDEELLLGGEDAPQIVGEYSEEMGLNGLGGVKAHKWRSIVVKEEKEACDEMEKETAADKDLWGCKEVVRKIKDEFSPLRRNASKNKKRRTTPDISPPRRRQKADNYSPARRARKDNDSSSRNENQHSRRGSTDQSPARKKRSPAVALVCGSRKSSSVDHSPVRKRRDSLRNSLDQSPLRQRERISKVQSPLRRRPNYSDQSPPKRSKDSLDQSSSRRRLKVSLDQSPQHRHRRPNSDQSPPRRCRSSKSPLRIKREERSPDQSPPRKSKIKREQSPSASTAHPLPPPRRRSRWEKTGSASPPPTHKPKTSKTLDGKRAGLQDAKSIQTETEERRRQEERMFAEMSKDISGRDAEVQVRSTGRRGQRARDAQAEDPEQRRRKEAHEQKKKELYDRWGKGLKQIEDHRSRLVEQAYEGNKPLARYNDDEDLERHLRQQERADDPMLEYMRQKNKERQKQANIPTMPIYQGSFPENRFAIRPGYRWDGVDRSNGYEKKWFDVQNEKLAIQDEAYKYSVEDM